ncbi:MAG: diaminobutyrate acetyltransferase [Roseovarius sp.]|nr:diaminobutyrate acetyltransferase [Roseovarius sp.]
MWDLIRNSGALDENSMYCNLVQCDHFSETCVIAELDGVIVGWISAFIPPDAPDTLFVWQVAVGEQARGRGVAKKMLANLLERPVCADVKQLKTTITADNDASWALFNSFASNMDAELEREPHYKSRHPFRRQARDRVHGHHRRDRVGFGRQRGDFVQAPVSHIPWSMSRSSAFTRHAPTC